MSKIPYDYVADRAFRIIELSALFSGTIVVNNLLDELHDYLTACGWTQLEFDNETIKYIDSNWEPIAN